MTRDEISQANEETRRAWDMNAAFWGEKMGEGNDFFNIERPMQYYLNLGFQNGFVLDGFEERAFPPDHPQTNPLTWGGKFSEIPPVLVARLRLT